MEADTAAVMVGVAGEVLVAHGAASASEIAAALRTAREVALAGLSERVADRLAALRDRTAEAVPGEASAPGGEHGEGSAPGGEHG
jgi:fatty acid/phospholipid biosynthesis enzyme